MEETVKMCGKLHKLFNSMERFYYDFDKNDIPKNGIYIIFEKGETAHGCDRIVRVGTHTGDGQLPSRLSQHFKAENKDRSIFRKNVGLAILNKRKDPFIQQWDIDLTTRKTKEKWHNKIDSNKLNETEGEVTHYMQNNLSFVAFWVPEKTLRLNFESKIISTISKCEYNKPSKNWLGLFSPKEKIRESGLWLINGLYKEPLNEIEFKKLDKLAIK